MTVKARLRHTRLAPQKARLVADMIRGKNVTEAMNVLTFTRKKAAREIQALLKSALANAEENHKVVDVEDMVVEKITVDEGVAQKIEEKPESAVSRNPFLEMFSDPELRESLRTLWVQAGQVVQGKRHDIIDGQRHQTGHEIPNAGSFKQVLHVCRFRRFGLGREQ